MKIHLTTKQPLYLSLSAHASKLRVVSTGDFISAIPQNLEYQYTHSHLQYVKGNMCVRAQSSRSVEVFQDDDHDAFKMVDRQREASVTSRAVAASSAPLDVQGEHRDDNTKKIARTLTKRLRSMCTHTHTQTFTCHSC